MKADDLLAPVGLQTRTTVTDYIFPALGVFGTGVLVGAGVALLLAPKTGRRLRADLGDVAARVRRGRGGTPGKSANGAETMSQDELYDRAQELDIAGRSKMSRSELLEAVRSAS